MEGFKVFWEYQKRKNGDIIISQDELERMVNHSYETGYTKGLVEGMHITESKSIQTPEDTVCLD